MFTKATKTTAKLRAALFGPSGAGKTFTALRMATGMGGKIAVIDTEHGSASKYADRFTFDVCELQDQTVAGYIHGIRDAGGYDVLIIDSLTHGWKELLAAVEQIAKTKYKGNTWSAWSEGTPQQNAMIEALLSFPGHVIATMRSKTAWETADAGNGKSRPVRIGLAPEQGKGIEYEFDFLCELTVDHTLTVLKDRSGRFQDKIIELPDEQFGADLAAWLLEGEAAAPPKPTAAQQGDKQRLLNAIRDYMTTHGASGGFAAELIQKVTRQETGRERIGTLDELSQIETAIKSGKYALDSGEPIPDPAESAA